VAVELAQAQFDDRVRDAGPDGRMRVHDTMYPHAFALVWAQADRAGLVTELERARFLLRLEAEWQAGSWTEFRRGTSGVGTPGATARVSAGVHGRRGARSSTARVPAQGL
jgi:hypothetical protein